MISWCWWYGSVMLRYWFCFPSNQQPTNNNIMEFEKVITLGILSLRKLYLNFCYGSLGQSFEFSETFSPLSSITNFVRRSMSFSPHLFQLSHKKNIPFYGQLIQLPACDIARKNHRKEKIAYFLVLARL